MPSLAPFHVFVEKHTPFEEALYELVNRINLQALDTWNNPAYSELIRKQRYHNICPLTKESITYISEIMRLIYTKKGDLRRVIYKSYIAKGNGADFHR